MKWNKIVKEGLNKHNSAIIKSRKGHATFLRTQLVDALLDLPGVDFVDAEDDNTLLVTYTDGGLCHVRITEG